MSGIAGAVVQGMAVGTGSAIAHRAIGAMFGGSSAPAPVQEVPAQAAAAPAPAPVPKVPSMCAEDHKLFVECLRMNPTNVSMCESYMQSLQACQSAHNNM